MKNKVLVAMGIGIAAALAPVAINSVDAKADEIMPEGTISPIEQQDNGQVAPKTNEEKVDQNNDTVGDMQDKQRQNSGAITTDNAANAGAVIDQNSTNIGNVDSDAVNPDKKSAYDAAASDVNDAAAALDESNKALQEADEKLRDAEGKLKDNDGSNPSEYNGLVDDVNAALDDYNDKVYDSKEKAQDLKDKSDAYDKALDDLQNDTNKNLDDKALADAKTANEGGLAEDDAAVGKNADTADGNKGIIAGNKTDDKDWFADLEDADLLAEAKSEVAAQTDAVAGKKVALDDAKKALGDAKKALDDAKSSDDYNSALADYKAAQKNYNDAVDGYNGAKDDYKKALDKYSKVLSDYADAQNEAKLKSNIKTKHDLNMDVIPGDADTSGTLNANNAKKVTDITAASVDKTAVADSDAGKVEAVTTAIDTLSQKDLALQSAESNLKDAEEALNTAAAALKNADVSNISLEDYNKLVKALEEAEEDYKGKLEEYNTAATNYNNAAAELVNKYNEYLQAKNAKAVADKEAIAEADNKTATGGNALGVSGNDVIITANDGTVTLQAVNLAGLTDKEWYSADEKKAMQGLDDAWDTATADLGKAKTALEGAKSALEGAKTALDSAKASDANYSDLVAAYNSAVSKYNEKLGAYNTAVGDYNDAASALVGKYNELCKAQKDKYDAAEAAKITPLDALKDARTQAKDGTGVNVTVTDPTDVLGGNDAAIGDFTAKVKAAYKEGTKMTDAQIDESFKELFGDDIANLNTQGNNVRTAWNNLSDAAGKLNEAVTELNAAKKAIDYAADTLTEDDFIALKTAYNVAVDKYNGAASNYANAKSDYDDAVAAYNFAKNAILEFDTSVFVASAGNYDKIEADTTSIGNNANLMKANIEKLNLDSATATVQQIMEIIAADGNVTDRYTNKEKDDLSAAITLLMKGLDNTVKVGDKDVKVSDLQDMIKDAAATLSDDDGATDADVKAYNELIKAYRGFINDYNNAEAAYNKALDNYIGETVSQYKDTEKDNTPKDVVNVYNKNEKSGHIDVKVDGTVALEETEDGKTVIKAGSNYTVLGVYATEAEAKKSNGQKGLTFEYKDGKTTKSGTEKVNDYQGEYSFTTVSGQQYNNALKDSKNKSLGMVEVSSATFWVKYELDCKQYIEEFTISAGDRFKENSWFAGEDADDLKGKVESKEVVVGQEPVKKTVWTIDGTEFDSKSTSGWIKHGYGSNKYWTKNGVTVYKDPTKNSNWSSSQKPTGEYKDVTETYYNLSGCNIFEISKYICSNNSGLDLVLSLEVLQDLRDRKDLKPLEALNNALSDVKPNLQTSDAPDPDIIKADLNELDNAPDTPAEVGKIDAEVVNNDVINPGSTMTAPTGLNRVNDIDNGAKTPVKVTPDPERKAPERLSGFETPNYDVLNTVGFVPVSGDTSFKDLAALKNISAKLSDADYNPIELKPLDNTFEDPNLKFVVSPLYKLALPTPPTPPVTPPTGGGDDTPYVPGPTPTFVVPPVAPAVGGPAVLGARRDGGQVLGAKRGVDKAVLGKKRTAATGDSMAVFGWISALMTTLGGAGAAAGALKKSKKEEDAE